ncbi:MAG: aminotransferase class I/II-fold pyridoxal phosphate-dependent enzyme [Phycisphaeraceae bacterium]|nr:aminotransferase class I/II-fold pyridoxal phosphate-dependent enzyme [Phycisphaeraceae bacterium]
MFDPNRFITDRLRAIDASGIRRVFDLAAKLKNPINLSIGQPDFDVPQPVKDAAAAAIRKGLNSYTVTQGIAELHATIRGKLRDELPLWRSEDFGLLVTSGVSGGLLLALMTCVGPGDEVLIPDPCFVMYRHLITLAGAKAVHVDTYPDFQLTPERLAPLITPRTKMLMFNSPSNPTGVVSTLDRCRQIAAFCDQHNILLMSDEIYDEFCYEKVERPAGSGVKRCPSPADFSPNVLLLRGYSKTYGMTGWRLGYAAGPKALIEQMTKLQQYSFVCAPSMVQWAGLMAHEQDMTPYIDAYARKRDRVVQALRGTFELTTPGGAFYAFPKVPDRLGLTGAKFVEKAVERGLLIIPGNVFSARDTHFRISYACDEKMLDRGLELLLELAK